MSSRSATKSGVRGKLGRIEKRCKNIWTFCHVSSNAAAPRHQGTKTHKCQQQSSSGNTAGNTFTKQHSTTDVIQHLNRSLSFDWRIRGHMSFNYFFHSTVYREFLFHSTVYRAFLFHSIISIPRSIQMLYKTNNECFLIRAMERIFSFGERLNVPFNSADASLNGTFNLSPHENILTIALINIHYLYNIAHGQFSELKHGNRRKRYLFLLFPWLK